MNNFICTFTISNKEIPENQNITQWIYGFIAKDENHNKERIIYLRIS